MATDRPGPLAAAAARKHDADDRARRRGASRARPCRRRDQLPGGRASRRASHANGSTSNPISGAKSNSSAPPTAARVRWSRPVSARPRHHCVNASDRCSTRTTASAARATDSAPSSQSPTASSATPAATRDRLRRDCLRRHLGREDVLDPPSELVDRLSERCHGVQLSGLAPARDIRDRVAIDP